MRTATPAHAAETSALYGTPVAAWGELIARHPTHAATLEAIAAGQATTRKLPVELATLAAAAAGPDLIEAATAGDTRVAVRETVEQHTPLTTRRIAELAATLGKLRPDDARARWVSHGYTVAAAVISRVTDHGFRPDDRGATTSEAVAALLRLNPTWDEYYPGTPGGPTRGRYISAALHAGAALAVTRVTDGRADLRAAEVALAELAADPAHIEAHGAELASATATLAALTWDYGGTLAEMAEVLNIEDLAQLDDDAATAMLHTWAELEEDEDGPPIDEPLTALTATGTRVRTCESPLLHRLTPRIPVAVAFAAQSSDLRLTATGIVHLAERGLCDRDPAEFLTQLEHHRELGELIHASIHERCTAELPDEIIDANMTELGIGGWARRRRVAPRVAAAAAAAGFRPAEWALIWRHIEHFRGTPEELIAVIAEAAH